MKQYTNDKMPIAWQKAVEAEKTAEILVYQVVNKCMETMSDVSIELDATDPVCKALASWTLDEKVGFGKNALSITAGKEGKIVIACHYDVWKLRDDLEMMASDIFGTINSSVCGEDVLDDKTTEISDERLAAFEEAIQVSAPTVAKVEK